MTTLDLLDGSFQIPIRISDRHKTIFNTGERLLQFKKMPQGFKNSPAAFQRYLSIILEGFNGKVCLLYVDDILIYGSTCDEHDLNVRKVLECLNEYGIVDNHEKRVFRKQEIDFLRYRISGKTIKSLIRKI